MLKLNLKNTFILGFITLSFVSTTLVQAKTRAGLSNDQSDPIIPPVVLPHGDPAKVDDVDLKIRTQMALEPVEKEYRPIRYMLFLNEELDRKTHVMFQDMIIHIQEIIDYNKTASFWKKRVSYTYPLSVNPGKEACRYSRLEVRYGDELRYDRDYFSSLHSLLSALEDKAHPLASISDFENGDDHSSDCPELKISAKITISASKLEAALNLIKQKDQELGWEVPVFYRYMATYQAREAALIKKTKGEVDQVSIGCRVVKADRDDRKGDYCTKDYGVVFPAKTNYFLDIKGACELSEDDAKKKIVATEICKFKDYPVLGKCIVQVGNRSNWTVALRSNGDYYYSRDSVIFGADETRSSDEALNFMKSSPLCQTNF